MSKLGNTKLAQGVIISLLHRVKAIRQTRPMNLFQCADATLDGGRVLPGVQTPLGVIRLDAILDDTEVADMLPTQNYRLPSGGWIVCWHQPKFDLELLICRPVSSIPAHIQLIDCWAGLWRLCAKQTVSSCNFTATWEQGFTWGKEEPQSSQWVYARTWSDGQSEVSVGTDDEDALAARSHQGNDLPHEWEEYFRSSSNHFSWFSLQPIHNELGKTGLAVPLPLLAAGRRCQVQFVVAWGPYQKTGTSTSLEVDRKASEVLAGAGCS